MTLSDLHRLDDDHMYQAVLGFGEQLLRGRTLAQRSQVSKWPGQSVSGLVICGMGGSALGGDILRTLAADTAQIPIAVVRGYTLPAWVGENTAVIASSYSGNTEETLAALDVALERGACVLIVTTGGALEERADKHGLDLLKLPGGLQPRAALPYSMAALVTVCEQLELTDVQTGDWTEASNVCRDLAERLLDPDRPGNMASEMAQALHGHIPVIYSSEQLAAANLRWRNQLHENAKVFAVGNLLPEMNHNEVMGWSRFGSELANLAVVMLRDVEDHPRIQRRLNVTQELLEPHAGSWNVVHSKGKSRLARLLSLMHVSDWVSLYLAILNKVDPSPVGLISRLKKALANP